MNYLARIQDVVSWAKFQKTAEWATKFPGGLVFWPSHSMVLSGLHNADTHSQADDGETVKQRMMQFFLAVIKATIMALRVTAFEHLFIQTDKLVEQRELGEEMQNWMQVVLRVILVYILDFASIFLISTTTKTIANYRRQKAIWDIQSSRRQRTRRQKQVEEPSIFSSITEALPFNLGNKSMPNRKKGSSSRSANTPSPAMKRGSRRSKATHAENSAEAVQPAMDRQTRRSTKPMDAILESEQSPAETPGLRTSSALEKQGSRRSTARRAENFAEAVQPAIDRKTRRLKASLDAIRESHQSPVTKPVPVTSTSQERLRKSKISTSAKPSQPNSELSFMSQNLGRNIRIIDKGHNFDHSSPHIPNNSRI